MLKELNISLQQINQFPSSSSNIAKKKEIDELLHSDSDKSIILRTYKICCLLSQFFSDLNFYFYAQNENDSSIF